MRRAFPVSSPGVFLVVALIMFAVASPAQAQYNFGSNNFFSRLSRWLESRKQPTNSNNNSTYSATTYSYFNQLPTIDPRTPLRPDEMRITFLGSTIPEPRRAQAEMSIFVEVGWVADPTDEVYGGRAKDQMIFDIGAGSSVNYNAMSIGFRRMDKIFINHLHADHMTDLMHVYCFGPSGDRRSPLYVFGPSPSGIRNPYFGEPGEPEFYNDGTKRFCELLREAARWHTESFGFEPTSIQGAIMPTQEDWGLPVPPIPVGLDLPDDAYAMIPIELDWTKKGDVLDDNVAYWNGETGVKVTHYPVIHCRQGSIGYKVEWNGLSMIYSSDTKPEENSIIQASNGGAGVDVFIHEMVVPPAVWAYKNMGLNAPPTRMNQTKIPIGQRWPISRTSRTARTPRRAPTATC